MEVNACRVCLTTELPLNSFSESGVKSAFEDIIDCAVEVGNGLPQHICDLCKDRVLRYAEFKTWCLSVQGLLNAELSNNKLITKQVIADIKHTVTQNFTPPDTKPWIKITDILDYDDADNKLKQYKEEDTKRECITEEEFIQEREYITEEEFIQTEMLPTIQNDTDWLNVKDVIPEVDLKEHKDNDHNDGNYENDADSEVQIIDGVDEHETDSESPKKSTVNIKEGFSNKVGKIPQKLATSKVEQMIGNTIIKKVGTQVQSDVSKKGKGIIDSTLLVKKIIKKNNYTWKPIDCGYTRIKKLDLTEKIKIRNETIPRKVIGEEFKVKVVKAKCQNCKYVFLNEPALQRHSIGCTKNATCKPCGVCGEGFPDWALLGAHMATKHAEKPNKKYACVECTRSFTCKSTLGQHWKNTHELKEMCTQSKEGLVCEQCGIQLKSLSELRYHMTTHTGEKRFQCDVCQKRFRVKYSLKVHMNTHTGKKPFKCSLCSTSFRHVSHKIRHMRTHTGEQPYQCFVCARRFANKYNMTSHIRTVHEGFAKTRENNEC